MRMLSLPDDAVPHPMPRILKARDLGVGLTAAELASDAKAKAQRWEGAARAAFRASRAQGWREGHRAGAEAARAETQKLASALQEMHDDTEAEIATLAQEIAQDIVGALPECDVLQGILSKALEERRDRQALSVVLSDSIDRNCKDRMRAFLAASPVPVSITFMPGRARWTCELHTPSGVIDLSPDRQFERLADILGQGSDHV